MASRRRYSVGSDLLWKMKRDAGDANDGYPDCPYCESPFFYADGEVDHIECQVNGGSNRKKNLVLVCHDCNQSKHSLLLTQWLLRNGISPEGVYVRLKRLGKTIPSDMLNYLKLED